MAANRNNEYRILPYRQTYVGDNLARQEEVVQAPEPKTEKRLVRREEVQIHRNRERTRSMSLPYVCAMLVVVGLLGVVCQQYLQIQHSISSKLTQIASLENELSAVQKENEALRNEIGYFEDYEYIYNEAVNRLGMQPAEQGQVQYFDLTESEYVKQNESIPKN